MSVCPSFGLSVCLFLCLFVHYSPSTLQGHSTFSSCSLSQYGGHLVRSAWSQGSPEESKRFPFSRYMCTCVHTYTHQWKEGSLLPSWRRSNSCQPLTLNEYIINCSNVLHCLPFHPDDKWGTQSTLVKSFLTSWQQRTLKYLAWASLQATDRKIDTQIRTTDWYYIAL